MSVPRSARDRVRAEIVREIRDAARAELGDVGAAGLSLRAVARRLGMVPSALYRYHPSRDDLLSSLLVEAYRSLADAASAASGGPADPPLDRWLAVGRAIRGWAVARPQEWALLYGTPVPGYRAPEATLGPATDLYGVMAGIVTDAARAGTLDPPPVVVPVAPALTAGLVDIGPMLPGLSTAAQAAAVAGWTQLLGAISLQMFGHYTNAVGDPGAFTDHLLLLSGRVMGLTGAGSQPGTTA